MPNKVSKRVRASLLSYYTALNDQLLASEIVMLEQNLTNKEHLLSEIEVILSAAHRSSSAYNVRVIADYTARAETMKQEIDLVKVQLTAANKEKKMRLAR